MVRTVTSRETSIAFESTTIQLHPEPAGSWIVEVHGQIAGGSDRHGDLLLLTQGSPLPIVACTTDRGQATQFKDESRGAVGVRITTRDAEQRGWNGTTIRLQLRWAPGRAPMSETQKSQRVSAPCLVLPDMMPSLTEAAAPIYTAPPRALTQVSFASELPKGLGAGGVARTDARGRPSPNLLQTVIFPEAPTIDRFEDLAIADGDPEALRRAHQYASPLLAFLRKELRLPLPMRPVIYLTDDDLATMYAPSGAFCPMSAGNVGARKPNAGKPISVVRLLSQAWFAAGVRVWGENAHNLRLALGGALGMRWLEAAGEDAALQKSLATADTILDAASIRGKWSVTETVLAMQVPIFRGMQRNGITSKLSDLLRSRWGGYVLQSEIVSLLRDSGVVVPHVFE